MKIISGIIRDVSEIKSAEGKGDNSSISLKVNDAASQEEAEDRAD